MIMSNEEQYLNELNSQIRFLYNELGILKFDYDNVNDVFAKTYIYDIIEQKERRLLQLLKEVNYGIER